MKALLVSASIAVAIATHSTPARAVDFEFNTTQPVLVDTLRALVKLVNYVRNNEAVPQVFTITKTQAMPPSPGWWASICIGDFCLAPFVASWDTPEVAPGDSVKVSTWVQCDTVRTNPGGSGHVTLTVMPYETPQEGISRLLTAITDNIDVLIVDDDGGENYETYYSGALPPGKAFGRWPREMAAPDSAALARFQKVIWLTGEASPSLDASDRATLSAYIAGGGRVLLTGQDIASDLCDPISPHYSPEACAWLAETFHASYVSEHSVPTGFAGVEDDQIGDGLDFEIFGGTGADNQTSPDEIAATESGVPFLAFRETIIESLDVGGVHNCGGSANTVFLAFGVEGIADDADRSTLIQRVFTYFDAVPADVDCPEPPLPPILFDELARNTPNPFFSNTQFTIRLVAPGPVALGIYDTGGRLVRTLVSGSLAAGETPVVWDGRDDDDDDLPSGFYFARLVSPERTTTRKLSLVR